MARIRMDRGRVRPAEMRIAKPPPKEADPYYKSPEWLALRAAALKRDGGRCVIAGCGERAKVVDHIVSRKSGGPDTLENLRSLCARHDNRWKEEAGRRRGGGG